MNRFFAAPLLVCALVLFAPVTASAVTIIPTVPVGNVGNANDPLTGNLYGGVSYAYSIGTTEVTNAQYADFLNAKAASDPLNLYSALMASDARGGITRSGVSGSFAYVTKANMADKPANYVSWYDSIRFANWLNNGQGTGSTETGAYTILGNTATPSSGLSIIRNPGAMWFLTSESEWYKAAYYQPAAQGGDADNYWLYATKSNSTPTLATANGVGDISNPGTNVANYNNGAAWNSLTGMVTTVGSAGPLSQGFYGTSDMDGNVEEWNEALVGSSRRVRGGAYNLPTTSLASSGPLNNSPTIENPFIGFRVATVSVPEPSTAVLGIIGCGLLLWWGKRRK